MSRLAREQDAVNLGQGFPDDPGPRTCARRPPTRWSTAGTSIRRCSGCPSCARRSRRITGTGRTSTLDPDSEIMVTSGATEAIAGEPDGADRAGRRGGAVPAALRRLSAAGAAGRRRAALRPAEPPHWRFTGRRWRARSRRRRKLVLFNNPLNPVRHGVRRATNLELLARSARSSTPSRSATRCGST